MWIHWTINEHEIVCTKQLVWVVRIQNELPEVTREEPSLFLVLFCFILNILLNLFFFRLWFCINFVHVKVIAEITYLFRKRSHELWLTCLIFFSISPQFRIFMHEKKGVTNTVSFKGFVSMPFDVPPLIKTKKMLSLSLFSCSWTLRFTPWILKNLV